MADCNILFRVESFYILLYDIKMESRKVFLIINSYYIGDILLVNPLVQNIKRLYSDSKVVLLTPPNMVDVAKYQEGVDDVVVWDRHGKHHGFFNMIKFIKDFPYKNIYAAFPIYSGDRAIILSFLLKAKYILGFKNNIFRYLLKSKYKAENYYGKNYQLANIYLLQGLTNEPLMDCHIKLNLPDLNSEIINKISELNGDYMVFCPKSSNVLRDMSDENALKVIEKYDDKIVLIGSGQKLKELSYKIKEKGYKNVIDLTNKTSILEAFIIINQSKFCLTVNTGMLHVATALNKKVIGVFYDENYNPYQPSKEIYPNTEIFYNKSVEEILSIISTEKCIH